MKLDLKKLKNDISTDGNISIDKFKSKVKDQISKRWNGEDLPIKEIKEGEKENIDKMKTYKPDEKWHSEEKKDGEN